MCFFERIVWLSISFSAGPAHAPLCTLPSGTTTPPTPQPPAVATIKFCIREGVFFPLAADRVQSNTTQPLLNTPGWEPAAGSLGWSSEGLRSEEGPPGHCRLSHIPREPGSSALLPGLQGQVCPVPRATHNGCGALKWGDTPRKLSGRDRVGGNKSQRPCSPNTWSRELLGPAEGTKHRPNRICASEDDPST